MLGLRAMAGLTVHSFMRTGGKLVVLVCVTGLARGASGKGNRPLADVVECRSPVETVLAKSGRDGQKSESKKRKDSSRYQNDQAH